MSAFMTMLGPIRNWGAVPWYLPDGITAANCVAAYQAVGATSYAASKLNLNSLGTHALTDGAAYPTWDANGWTFDGTQYLVTDITPPRDQTWTVVVLFRGATWSPTAWETAIGSFSTSGGNSGFLVQFGNTAARGRGAWTGSASATSALAEGSAGSYSLSGKHTYKEGASDLTVASGVLAGNHLALWIGGLNLDGALSQGFKGTIRALAIYNVELTQ